MASGVLYLPERGSNRVLGFNAIPAVNNEVADFVLGQPDFATTTPSVSATQFSGPQTVVFDDGKMIMVSYDKPRVLIWSSIPATGGVVLGQSSFSNVTANDDDQDGVTDTASARKLNFPAGVIQVGHQLIVADKDNNRYLVLPGNNPASSGALAGVS